jgi:hypothetical protein
MYPVSLVILTIYILFLYFLGARVIKILALGLPVLLSAGGALLIGMGIGVPVTYLYSCVMIRTNDPIFWGVVLSSIFFGIVLWLWKDKRQSSIHAVVPVGDILLAVATLVFSSWMMFKTFHGDASGQLFVGSNNVFDFGHDLGIIRSFSWGNNFPMMSPFESGSPFFYHFFFYFWVAIWEHFGIPVVWAVNIPSILSFAALLIIVYFLPQIVAKQKSLAGWIAVALTVTNSSLTFWYVKNLSNLWRLPSYPFTGPFDGSTISLFMTLNNYVNQRHLAFSVALGLLLYLVTVRALETKKTGPLQMGILGLITGLLLFWNMAVCALVGAVITLTLLVYKTYKAAVWYVAASIIVGLACALPVIPFLASAAGLVQSNIVLTAAVGYHAAEWNIITYLWKNLGILPPVAAAGYILISNKAKRYLLPVSTLFVAECALTSIAHKGFDQKFLSFLIIPVNIIAAAGLVWLWERRRLIWKLSAVLLFCVLTLSGIIDLMPIKNAFAFPLVNQDTAKIISWIHGHTPKDAVFVSYADIIDPVVLAGNRNYFGFFGNIGWQDRTGIVRDIYSGDIELARGKGIDYILIPKQRKSDFPYVVDVTSLTKKYVIVYEDAKFLILQTGNPRPAITIINPVRGSGLGHETDDLVASLKAQWQVTHEEGIHATWLFQYGALENTGIIGFAKQQMKGEEFGLLFEIDRSYAEKAYVRFRGQGPWYSSDGLFLNSYDRSERRQLIDTAFAKFKEIFGYYPKTVGAWWIGGDSLTYMQEKYGITAAMRAADQFNLDFYSIWGTPWNIPYLPSKENEGMPAASFDQSAKVVVLQWAIRDPLKGYADPLYSLQDYPMKGYTPEYVDYLASIYLQKPFGNFVIGLENGGTVETFGQFYKTMLSKAKEYQASGNVDILLARDYAEHYLTQKKVFAGETHFLSTDYGSGDQSFWYLSENYRAAVHKMSDTVYLVDLRNYANKTEEDFHILPNSQSHLRINEPAVIDSMRFPDERILIKTIKDPLTVKEQNATVSLYAGNEKLATFTPTEITIQADSRNGKTFSFVEGKSTIYPSYILYALYILYFGVIFLQRKNFQRSLKDYLFLLIPLLFAFPFLVSSPTFLFDKKETAILAGLFSLHLFPVLATAYVSKILPFAILFILHYLFIMRRSGKIDVSVYWGYYALTVFLYLHLPYFPLDKTTYVPVIASCTGIAVALLGLAVFIILRYKIKNSFVLAVIIITIISLSLATTVVFSRSRYALTMYEINAMQKIKDQKKSVIYVEQVDYSIRPIYKAVRPLLYGNYQLGQIMTGTKWEIVMRPESNILKLSGYDNKLIVIPRYLGSDMSEYEMTSLHLKKIFDNAQIALFEKIKS